MSIGQAQAGVDGITHHGILFSLLEQTLLTFRRAIGTQNIRIRFANTDETRLIVSGDAGQRLPRGFIKYSGYERLRLFNNLAINNSAFIGHKESGGVMTVAHSRCYPIELSGDFNWITDSGRDAFKMVDVLTFLSQGQSLAFAVQVSELFEYKTQIKLADSFSVEEGDFLSEDKKAVFMVNAPFTVRGWTGRIDLSVRPLVSFTRVTPEFMPNDPRNIVRRLHAA